MKPNFLYRLFLEKIKRVAFFNFSTHSDHINNNLGWGGGES